MIKRLSKKKRISQIKKLQYNAKRLIIIKLQLLAFMK